MLATLTVSNFALIDNISIDFNNGLSVLTGETGAGKSLIIDAISLLLGGRASTQMIREGASKAIIEGIFTEYNPKINNILEDIGIETSDEGLIVKREINVNGKSISRINGSMVTLSQLEEVSSLLADIHTQLDTKKLFDLRNYVDFLDDDSVLPKALEYNQLRKEYLTVVKEYNKIKKDLQDDLDNLDYLKYRYNELKSLHLVKDEVESLEEELKILDNYETIYNSLYTIKNAFHDKDILDTLYDIKNTLLKLSEFDNKLSGLVEIVNNSYYELEDVEKTVSDSFKKLDFDNDRLNEINDRLNILYNVQRKYKMNIVELIEYQYELENKINNSEQSDFIVSDYEEKVQNAKNKLINASIELTKHRKKNANILKDDIMNTLKDLCLPNVAFEIAFSDVNYDIDSSFKENGVDIVEFLVSFNLGETPKPLSKVASGGEMSRVMLAFKTHLLKNAKLSTIIFDEIDTGISGEVALAVANKIKEISKTTQVLSITHLPIVAASSDQHLLVYKEINKDRTVTNIRQISLDERIAELAKMISSKVDEASIQLAKQMIEKF